MTVSCPLLTPTCRRYANQAAFDTHNGSDNYKEVMGNLAKEELLTKPPEISIGGLTMGFVKADIPAPSNRIRNTYS